MFELLLFFITCGIIAFIATFYCAIYDLHKDYKSYNSYFINMSKKNTYVSWHGKIIERYYVFNDRKNVVDVQYISLPFQDIMNFKSLTPDKWHIGEKDVYYKKLYWIYDNKYIVYYKTYRDYKQGLKYKEQLEKEAEEEKQRKEQALANEQLATFLENVQEDINIVKQKAREDITKAMETTLTIANRLTVEQLVHNINNYFDAYGIKIVPDHLVKHFADSYNCSYFDIATIIKKLGGTICE